MSFPLSLVIKVTRSCNLRCVYCSEWRSQSPVMTLETAEALVARALEDSPPIVQFGWHGGEPTLVPISFYAQVVELQKRFQKEDQLVRNALQTNGTLLTADWIAFIRQNGFSLGISLDGPPELHDTVRMTAGNRPTFSAIRRNLDQLEEAHVPYSISMVLSHQMIRLGPDALWEFVASQGFGEVDIIPVLPPNRNSGRTVQPQFITRDMWIGFMKRLFDLWWEARSEMRIRILDSILRRVAGGRAGVCVIAGGCTGAAFGLEPDGRIFHCGLFQEEERFYFGNINETTFPSIRESTPFRELLELDADRISVMQQCPHYDLCSGGCPHDYYLFGRYGTGKADISCCGYGELISHIRARSIAEFSPVEAETGTKVP